MTPTLTAAIVAFITGLGGLVTALTIYVKTKTDNEKIRAERAETCRQRDNDSQELHDAVLKLQFQSTANKDNIQLLFDLNKDNTNAINTLNTQIATVLTKIDTIIDTLNEIKERQNETERSRN